jgi:hypothetical protein
MLLIKEEIVPPYADLEYDVTEKWLLNGALRYENYSDFEELQTIN